MSFSAVVFDLDGTLLNTLTDIANPMNRFLVSIGLESAPTEAYRTRVGSGLRQLVKRSLPLEYQTEELIERGMREWSREYERAPADATVPYPGVDRVLTELAAHGIPCSIISNKPDPLTQEVVQSLLGRYRFVLVQGDIPGMPRKPDPAASLNAARAMGVTPVETVFLGDSDVDMLTAIAAGMYPAGAAWGFRGAEELKNAGARAVLAQPLDLLDLMGLNGHSPPPNNPQLRRTL